MAAQSQGRERHGSPAPGSDGTSRWESGERVVQAREEAIALRQVDDRQWPRNAQPGIIEADPALGCRSERISVEVQEFAVGLQSLKAVSASFRDDKHPAILGRKFLRMPLETRLRARPQIDRHIKYPPFKAAHKLHLRMW